MINPDKIIAIFRFVETNYDLRNFEYKGINFWPLIRKEIGLQYNLNSTQKYTSYRKENALNHYFKLPFRFLKYVYFSIAIKKYKNTLPTSPAYFFVFPDSLYKESYHGKKYSKYLDPYYEIVSGKTPCVRFTIDTDTSDYFFPTISINTDLFFKWYNLNTTIFLDSKREKRHTQKIISAFNDINKLVKEKFQIEPFKESIISNFNTTLGYILFFTLLLDKKNAKAIFFECFYDEVKTALTCAAKDFKIKTIEIQHGGAEDNVYVPYVEDIKYKILPEYFWAWSNSDKSLINKMNNNFAYLKPFNAGNMWLKKIIDGEIELLPEAQNILSLVKKLDKKIVLITLQNPLFSADLFQKVIEINYQTHFIIVPHPYSSKKDIDDFTQKIKTCNNFSFIYNTSVSLLFKYADMQITHSSTSALEAVTFNLPTVICSSYGWDFFKQQINDGVIFFSEDIEMINKWIKERPVINEDKKHNYIINTSKDEALKKLNFVLN